MKQTHEEYRKRGLNPCRLAGLIGGLLLATVASAHDFWLEARPFYTPVGQPVDVSVHVGSDFVGDSLPNIRNWYDDFAIYLPGSKRPMPGKLGDDPAGRFVPDRSGTWLVGYQSTFSFADIDPETFRQYLIDEGLDNALAWRREQGLEQTRGLERYVRHAKTLVQAGEGDEVDASTLAIGYELEIVPESNPYRLTVGDELGLRLLYRGEPAPNLLLIAFNKQDAERKQKLRSDADGRARIRLDRAGPWMLKAVKIIPYQSDSVDPKARWQSHWANLTFELR